MNDAAIALGHHTISQRIKPLTPLGKYIVQITVVGLVYVVAGKLGQATAEIRSSNVGPVWPAYGVALAAILTCGYRVWPGVMTGAFVVAFFSPVSHIAALGQAAGSTIAATTGAFLLHRIVKFQPSLQRLSDALGLIMFGAFVSAFVSASLGTFVLYATHVHAYSGLETEWLIYWMGDATGVLLVTPLALVFPDLLKIGNRRRSTELAVLLLLLTGTCLIIFCDLPHLSVKLHFLAFAVFPFVLWAAIKFGMSGASLSMFFVATVATVATAYGMGPFSQDALFQNAVLLDVFFAVLSISGMMLAAVVTENSRLLREQASMEISVRDRQALSESEERLRLAAQVGKMYAYEWDVATDTVVRSSEYLSILNLGSGLLQLSRQQLARNVHPDDREEFTKSVDSLTPENPETHLMYRVVRPDGSVVWLENNGHAFFDSNGKMVKVIGMVADITERKSAEQELSGMSRKLLQAQEQERVRIARDLHDDIAQRLALLTIEHEEIENNVPDGELRTAMGALRTQMREVANNVQSLSHQLHSSKLEYLGIVKASRGFCKEFSDGHKVEIDFNSSDLTAQLPSEVSLCLFRVLQEALNNAVKHSGVKHFEVQLWETSGELHLTVCDRGKGFDLNAAMKGPGLGLTSMQERLRLVNGELLIHSLPQHGTEIHVSVPLKSREARKHAVGE